MTQPTEIDIHVTQNLRVSNSADHQPSAWMRLQNKTQNVQRHISYTIYTSTTAEPIWLKIGGEVA